MFCLCYNIIWVVLPLVTLSQPVTRGPWLLFHSPADFNMWSSLLPRIRRKSIDDRDQTLQGAALQLLAHHPLGQNLRVLSMLGVFSTLRSLLHARKD